MVLVPCQDELYFALAKSGWVPYTGTQEPRGQTAPIGTKVDQILADLLIPFVQFQRRLHRNTEYIKLGQLKKRGREVALDVKNYDEFLFVRFVCHKINMMYLTHKEGPKAGTL